MFKNTDYISRRKAFPCLLTLLHLPNFVSLRANCHIVVTTSIVEDNDSSSDSDTSNDSEEYDPTNPIVSSPATPKATKKRKKDRRSSSKKRKRRKSSSATRFRFPGASPKDEIAVVVKSFKCMKEIRGQRERFKKICRGVIKKVQSMFSVIYTNIV